VKISRKQALQSMAASAAGVFALTEISHAMNTLPQSLNSRINHSVCQWCYGNIPLEEFARAAKDIGLKSIELLGPEQWAVVQKHGLTCAMAYVSHLGLTKGFNDPSLHDSCRKSMQPASPKPQRQA
jgi:hydroxypyruvate isomerase